MISSDSVIKYFNYKVDREAPLEDLPILAGGRKRLQVYKQKGCICVECGAKGSRLVRGRAKDGSKHWVVVTSDLIPLTVDHILPKSLGGSNHIDNLQPMCAPCNFTKGNGLDAHKVKHKMQPFDNFAVGDDVWRVIPSRSRFKTTRPVLLGEISEIAINPVTGKRAFLIYRKENRPSYFDDGRAYFKALSPL